MTGLSSEGSLSSSSGVNFNEPRAMFNTAFVELTNLNRRMKFSGKQPVGTRRRFFRRVPHTSRTLRCVGFAARRMSRDHNPTFAGNAPRIPDGTLILTKEVTCLTRRPAIDGFVQPVYELRQRGGPL